MQTNIDYTNVKLSLPAGGWHDLAKANADLTHCNEFRWPGDGNWQVKFTEVKPEGADLWLSVRRLQDGLWTIRPRAIDLNGVDHPESYGTRSGETDGFYTWRYRFKDLGAGQVKEFLLQARRVETIQFHYVSLEWGAIKRVQIVEEPQKP